MASGFTGRMPTVSVRTQPAQGDKPGGDNPRTVRNFLNNPTPTILPQDVAGVPAQPIAMHMIGGRPYPQSAQVKMLHWNRAGAAPMPPGVTFNTQRGRMVQT